MTDNSLIEDFADETREHLEEMESSLLQLESDPENSELLNTIFRSIHTIKGASEYLGFDRIARLSHSLENLLDMFREGSLLADKRVVNLLIDARDRIDDLTSQVETTGDETSTIDDLLDRVSAIASGAEATDDDAPTAAAFTEEADKELFDIFIEQLSGGISRLIETVGRIARREGISQAVGEMADQVTRLAATANYMSYDALTAIYDDMQTAIDAFAPHSDSTDDEALETFLQTSIVAGIARIQDLFPDTRLKEIDTHIELEIKSASPVPADGDELLLDEEDVDQEATVDDLQPDPDLSLDMEDGLVLEPETPFEETPLSSESDFSLIKDFADETGEHLEELESCLLRLENDPANPELLNTIFRSVHTIKGASEYLGFERIAQLSHRLENLLDLFREGSLSVDKVAVDLLIDARDRMGELISQVEETGQESSEIDDLLDRVAVILSGSTSTGDAADASSTYESEADAELFDIFMEQLSTGIGQLLETAGRIARREGVSEAAEEMGTQVERLAATANYMGYDALSEAYGGLQTAIEAFISRSVSVDGEEIEAFLQKSIVTGIGCIKDLFPGNETMAAIDTSVLDMVPADTIDTDPVTETDSRSSSEIDQLLAGFPTIADSDRETLLSTSLDQTFASMKNADVTAKDEYDLQGEEDPIAQQFSSDSVGDDTTLSADIPNDRDEALAILDDFSTDREDHALPVDSSDPENEMDFWPQATEVFIPAPDASQRVEPIMPAIDFSTPSPSEASKSEESAEEDFSTRKTIRKSIRVDAEKVDDLMNQVGELVVNRSSFSQLFVDMRELTSYLFRRFSMEKGDQRLISDLTNRLSDATTILGRVTGELQEQVMKVRMLPISRLFNRYPRLVHDLLKEADKKVQLQFKGEETELDRMVIEQLADPMIHIIRNAVDHGIETRDERRRKGKPENGVLLLEAYHEGSNVVIEVTDDGKGIDLSRIRQKAVEKKLADRETLEQMGEEALIDMIMLPGFSTTDEITHTSGRGVGMDVVKQSIEKINGSLVVDTRQDVGTRFKIKIPLTLAIIPAMMIRCGGSHFTVPMSAVDETLRIDPGEIFTVDGSEVMHLNEEPLPLVRLTDLLNIQAGAPSPMGADDRLFVMVVKGAAGRTGFIVDTLLGRQEVVIKPMEDYLQENSGFSGATILGDGSISLILNVDELVIMAKEREAERKLAVEVL
jgi:two-component system chemotaxis sensor kinase CheA